MLIKVQISVCLFLMNTIIEHVWISNSELL